MAITIDQVRHWGVLDRNIGHIVMSCSGGWYYTACGTLTPSLVVQDERPARICRKCRNQLGSLNIKAD